MKNNKLNHEWSLLCSRSVVDRDTNNLSLVNLIEQVSLNVELQENAKWNEFEGDRFPINMEIVTRIRKLINDSDVVNGAIKIDFQSPDKKTLESFQQEFNLGEGMDNIRMRFGITALKLTQSGLYNFDVHVKEETEEKFTKAYSVPLKINLTVKEFGTS